MAGVLNTSAPNLEAALREAVTAHILVAGRRAIERFELRRALVQEALYSISANMTEIVSHRAC